MRYDLARELPQDYFSFTVATEHNHNITSEQLKLMLRDIPESEHDQFLRGMRPEGSGNFFSIDRIYQAEDEAFGEHILERAKKEIPGYAVETAYGAGVVYYTTPRLPGHEYFVIADPGTDSAPNRNAPVIMVWDVTDFPKYKMTLAAFWWGNGNGSITPFVRQLLKFMEMYDAAFSAVDATGPQKNTNEILNLYLIGGRTEEKQQQEWLGDVDVKKITNPFIEGLDFSSGKKATYLISGRLYLEAGLVIWPKMVHGIRSQLSNYDPDKDKTYATSKLTQDIVATYCMSAYAVRAYFQYDPSREAEDDSSEIDELFDSEAYRSQRIPIDERDLRSVER
jgi:hypothetical protein